MDDFIKYFLKWCLKYLICIILFSFLASITVYVSDMVYPYYDEFMSLDINSIYRNTVQYFGIFGNALDHVLKILELPKINFPNNEISLLEEITFGLICTVCYKFFMTVMKIVNRLLKDASRFNPLDIILYVAAVVCAVVSALAINNMAVYLFSQLGYHMSVISIILTAGIIAAVYVFVCSFFGRKKSLLEIGSNIVYMVIDALCIYTLIFFIGLINEYHAVFTTTDTILTITIIILCIIALSIAKGKSIFDSLKSN